MKRTLAFLLIVCLLAGLYGCGGSDDSPEASLGNVGNASFEDGFSFWSVTGEGAAVTDDSFHDGSKCLKIGASGDYEAHVSQRICALEPGYYYLEFRTRNDGNQQFCYAYGNGSGQDRCMTSVPVTAGAAGNDQWQVTTVRGIRVEDDGLLEIGMEAKGSGQFCRFDSVALCYEANQQRQYPSLFGGAVSWLDWEEDSGAKYYDENGAEKEALLILKENGCNFVRLELYNNPGAYLSPDGDYFPPGYKDADAIFHLARRADALGMKIQLSFMYSDYWGNDAIPADWQEGLSALSDGSMRTEYLSDAVYEYTYGFMTRLREAGITPAYVSLGNEIESGILLPYGSSTDSGESAAAFAGFLKSGYRAVKDASPESLVVLHISCNADDMHWENRKGMGRWFFDLMEEYGVPYDVIGTSFYPFWAQNDSVYAVKKSLDCGDLREWAEMMSDSYDRDILVMETGYNWGSPGQLANNGAYRKVYPSSPEGQRDYIIELFNTVKSVRDGRCAGCLYWDPILVRQEGIGYALYGEGLARPNVVETTTFFDYDHIALPVLGAYRYNTAGQ